MNTQRIKIPVLFLALVSFICFPNGMQAQDEHFSQFYESPLTLNPALCGSFNGEMLAEVNYRNQWPSALGSGYGYSTMAATVEYPDLLKSWNQGFFAAGLSFYSDKAGAIQLTSDEINFTIAGGVFLNNNSIITAGLQGGWDQNSLNLQSVPWDEQYVNGHYDPNASTGEPLAGNSISYGDFSGGIAYKYSSSFGNMAANQYTRYAVGIAVYHVNQPEISFFDNTGPGTKLYMRYVFHADAEFKSINSSISYAPALIFYQQGPAQEIDMGMKLRYKLGDQSTHTNYNRSNYADAGLYYRFGDSFIALLKMEFPTYSIGFSYDFNVSQYESATSGEGAFELSLRYSLYGNNTNVDSRSTY
ncbi:MAG TPA: PorP/SprF family type IX secretion system membrane protein [Bacteroidia bacterium]|jgi:type IX secretion system PorP/SprF family membrane protein|nr:PorP/SprF family type IX secretion system membrane protein [Bacteroidia bacterium]